MQPHRGTEMNEMETGRGGEERGESKLLFLIHTMPSPYLTTDEPFNHNTPAEAAGRRVT